MNAPQIEGLFFYPKIQMQKESLMEKKFNFMKNHYYSKLSIAPLLETPPSKKDGVSSSGEKAVKEAVYGYIHTFYRGTERKC